MLLSAIVETVLVPKCLAVLSREKSHFFSKKKSSISVRLTNRREIWLDATIGRFKPLSKLSTFRRQVS